MFATAKRDFVGVGVGVLVMRVQQKWIVPSVANSRVPVGWGCCQLIWADEDDGNEIQFRLTSISECECVSVLLITLNDCECL